ncbi:E3_ubiquitin-protein ligase [Hexamita inflata]|uniref:E3 ubiquitin-protein ligase n=1 Tax=Hexamita inflata TaxID=28002 RepID=A0ABP1GI42_9EUKA
MQINHLQQFLTHFIFDDASIQCQMSAEETYQGTLQPPQDFLLQIIKIIVKEDSQFYPNNNQNAMEILKKIYQTLPRTVCGSSIQNEPAVKCYTCSQDACSIICMNCFDEKNHIGHNYKIIQGSGMCDCGYAQTIKPSGFCKNHCGNQHKINLFEKFQDDFNVKKLFGVLIYLCRHIIIYAQKSLINQSYVNPLSFFIEIIINLLHYPIDIFRRAFSNVLIFTKDEKYQKADLIFNNPFKYIQKYFDITQFIIKFRNQEDCKIMQDISLALVFMLLLNLGINHPCIMGLSKFLIEQQISEPCFRMYMSYAYYLINPKVIMGSVLDSVYIIEKDNIFFSKNTIQPYQLGQSILLDQNRCDPWFNASVQSHNCVTMDQMQLILSQFSEQTEAYLLNVRLAQGRDQMQDDCFLNAHFLNSIIQQGLSDYNRCFEEQLPYITNKNDHEQMKFGAIKINYYQTLLINAIMQCPYLCYYDQDKQVFLKDIVTQTAQLFHKQTTICWSMKNVNFMKLFFNSKLPLLSLVQNMQLYSKIYVIRRKQRECISDDENYTMTLINGGFNHRVYYQKLAQILFVSAFVDDENQDYYNLSSQISRACSSHAQISSNNSINYELILQILLNSEMYNLVQKRNMYKTFQQCKEPKHISEGFGLHTIKPLINEGEKEYHHPVINEMITCIAIVLNLLELQNKCNVSDILRNSIITANPSIFTLPYNQSFIISQALRLIVTKSLSDSKMMQRIGEKTQIFFSLAYSQQPDRIIVEQFHWYQLIQQVLQSLNSEQYTETDFIHQILETFGFLSFDFNQFIVTNNEDTEKKMKMLGDLLNTITILQQSKIQITNPDQYLQQNIILFLIQYPKVNVSKIHQSFSNMELYNYDYFQQLLDQVATLKQFEFKTQQIYRTGQLCDEYEINQFGMNLIFEFNPMFAESATFLNNYELLLEKHHLLEDRVTKLLQQHQLLNLSQNSEIIN